ncbi:Hepatitis A virus cellular receptor 1 like protein [Myotis brandtii]|uniref:Hepatitis A virus cellular receptor 1 like protein n=1 Tax=Myotis brandtii TaxID=109478 RepID=S7PI77_MYOBR|nr:Hepatitis A virus cellular receptor 1 like protein [Myotis brandtii]
MCWGRGPCPLSKCSNTLISTDGYRVTYEKDKRYRMNGIISRGDVSLTIQNAALSDTGTYCCRIEYSGFFNYKGGNIFLEIKPAPTTVPTPPKVFSSAPTTPGTTKNRKTAPTTVPTPPKVFSSAPSTPATTQNLKTETTSSSPVQTTETPPITPQETSTTSSSLNSSRPTDGNSTVTQPSDYGWQYNETDTILKQNTQRNTSKLYIGLCIAAMILLTILAAILTKNVVVSQTRVTGVVGQSVTLPCTYSTAGGIAPMCWGQGPCSLFRCSNTLVSTDGYRVTFEKDKRYRMNGIISRGNLSLTIQNAALSDTGTYCCRIEFKGWFNDYKENIFLEIKPAPTTAPTPPKVFSSAPTTPGTTKNLKTAPPKVTSVPTPPKVSTYAPIIPEPTWNLKTAIPNVTMIPTSPTSMVSTSATATPAPTQKFKTDNRNPAYQTTGNKYDHLIIELFLPNRLISWGLASSACGGFPGQGQAGQDLRAKYAWQPERYDLMQSCKLRMFVKSMQPVHGPYLRKRRKPSLVSFSSV